MAFLQLTIRQSRNTTVTPILECLLPSIRLQTTPAARGQIPRRTFSSPSSGPSTNLGFRTLRSRIIAPTNPQILCLPSSYRSFSASSSRPKTVSIHNPPTDSSFLEITPRAAARLATIASKDANANLALRIQVESGGCHGFQYLMSLITLPELKDAPTSVDKDIIREDDTIFAYVEDSVPEAEVAEAAIGGAKIILDGPSLDLLKGSKVDFTQELIGSQFKIVDNPFATSSCGCGTSFDIKLD